MARESKAGGFTLILRILAGGFLLPAGGIASSPDGNGASSNPEVVRLSLSRITKRLCSAIWVSERDLDEAIPNSVLLTDEQVRDHQAGRLRFGIDHEKRIVTGTWNGVSTRVRHFGDQGCVILPPGSDEVFFAPRKVNTRLPDPDSTDWPMGDRLPDEALPADVDGERLAQGVRIFFSNPENRRAAFLVVHRDRLIAEEYASGAHRAMQLESWSMGKAMTATLIGRLIQMGHLGLWDRAPVPAWRNAPGDPRAAIRIADLLRMSSGLQFTGTGASPEELAGSFVPGFPDHLLGYAAPIDIFRFVTSRSLEHPPNTVGRYRNCDPWVLGAIVRRTVESLGEDYLTWPQRALFDRIGIRRFILETDPYGNFILTGYNFGTARDWARFGMLYLHEGMWNEERLLSREFVEFVQTPSPAWPERGGQFALNRRPGGRRAVPALPDDAYFAAGAGSQRTFIIPSRSLVIVALTHRRGPSVSRDSGRVMNEALGHVVKAVDPSWTW